MALVLLGAGASQDAGIPTAVEMTHRMIAEFQGIASIASKVPILHFVAGGLQFKRGIRGEDPFEGINIEELFAAMDMLAKRTEIDAAPFVGQWHPAIADLEAYRPEGHEFSSMRDKLRHLIPQGRYAVSTYERSRGADPAEADRFIMELERIVRELTTPRVGEVFADTADAMIKVLKHLVWVTELEKVDYLGPLVKRGNEGLLSVATLNYDNTVELACEAAGTSVSTGIQRWSSEGVFPKPESGIELLKLHGSVDWVLQEQPPTADAPIPHDLLVQVEKDKVLGGRPYRPAVVFGAGNKLTARGPFLDLLHTFRERLMEHDQLIVIGYSFRDEHVNELIIRWLNGAHQRQITIVERDGAVDRENAFYNRYSGFVRGRFEIRPEGARKAIQELFSNPA